MIIEACEQHKSRTGAYPAKLDDLVPGYLARIPIARYTVASGGFRYLLDREPSGDGYTIDIH